MEIIPDLKMIEKAKIPTLDQVDLRHVFDIRVIAGETSDEQSLQYEWSMVEMTERHLRF